MRPAFNNPVGRRSRLAALTAEPAISIRPLRRLARLLSLVLLAAVVLWVAPAAAQTVTISPTGSRNVTEGDTAVAIMVSVANVPQDTTKARLGLLTIQKTSGVTTGDFNLYDSDPSMGSPTALSLLDAPTATFPHIYHAKWNESTPTNIPTSGTYNYWLEVPDDSVLFEDTEALEISFAIHGSGVAIPTAESATLTLNVTDAPLPTPTGKPTTPANLEATAGKGAVTLAWDAVDATSSNTNRLNDVQITKHQVRRSTDGDISDETWNDIPNSGYGGVNATTYTIGSLMDGTEYTFQVRAVNGCTATTDCGNSDAATAVMATPVADALAQPTGLMATAGNTVVTLTWTDPGNAAILYYEYQQKKGIAAFGDWTEIRDSTATTTSYRLTGLDNGTAYSYRIRARTNVKPGPASDAVTATPRGVPPVAPVLTATPRDSGVTLSWPNPVDASLTGYEYQYKVDAEVYGPWRAARERDEEDCEGSSAGLCAPPYVDTSGATLQFPVGGLTNGTPHTFRIRAVNVDGTATSNEVTATPVAGVPAKPTGLTTRLHSSRVRVLEWDRVADPSILRYEFTTDDGRTWSLLSSDPTESSSTLPEGEFLSGYTFRIRAVNAAGPGPPSDLSVEKKIARAVIRVYLRHDSTSLEWDATTKKATLAWDPTEHANFRWWTVYFSRVEHLTAGGDWDTDLPIGTTRYEIPTTFNAGDAIVVFIAGCVSAPCITRSNIVFARELRFAAGAPSTVITGFSATPGEGEITLAWDNPMDSSITHFEYRGRKDGISVGLHEVPDGDDPGASKADETSHTFTATNGASYDFQLRAANANGSAPWSDFTNPVMPLAVGVPAAPSGVVTLTSGAGSGHDHGHGDTPPALTLWDDPRDPSITVYQEYTSGTWQDIPGTDATTTGVDDSIVRLRAVNANGVGPPARRTTVHSPTPARPKGLRAAPGNGRVTLTWDDPGRGVYIEFYRYTADGGETWTEIDDSQSTAQGQFTRYTVQNLTNGQAYTFAIQAENDTGASSVSAAVTATPRGGAPAKPTDLSAAPGNAEVTLTWDNPIDNSITKYQVKQDAAAWADIAGSNAGTTSHTVGTLTNGTAYTFQVRAVNDHDGNSTDDPGVASDAVTVTPGVPEAPASLTAAPGDTQVTLTWTAPASDNGSAVTGYEYTSNADAATPVWTDVPDSGSDGRADETEYTVTGLVNNTSYAFAVRAENANGQGPATPTLRATPVHPDAPQRPAGLRANPGHREVRLAWSRPVNPNHPVTSYEYRQSTDGGTNWSPDWTAIPGSGADTAEHRLTGLANGTTYTFELRALKGSTAGPAARAQATPRRAAAREVYRP